MHKCSSFSSLPSSPRVIIIFLLIAILIGMKWYLIVSFYLYFTND